MIVGITGGIGSGKSTILQELAKQGYAVYDCDKEAKRIIAEEKDIQEAITVLLGQEAFIQGPRDKGPRTIYNTAYVAQRVFAEPELLKELNGIVHPAVKRDIMKRSAFSRQPSDHLFIESAILYEAGFDSLCDKIVVIDAPEDVRIERVIGRDYHGDASAEHINKVRARIRNQQSAFRPQPSAISNQLYICNDGKTSIRDLVSIITHRM
jgi:dephospho-CoA kinase